MGEAGCSTGCWCLHPPQLRPCLRTPPQIEFPLDTICTAPTKGWFQLLPFPSTTETLG